MPSVSRNRTPNSKTGSNVGGNDGSENRSTRSSQRRQGSQAKTTPAGASRGGGGAAPTTPSSASSRRSQRRLIADAGDPKSGGDDSDLRSAPLEPMEEESNVAELTQAQSGRSPGDSSSLRRPVSASLFSSPLHYARTTPRSRSGTSTPGGQTPRGRRRPDLDLGMRNARHVELEADLDIGQSSTRGAPSGPRVVIWGTNVEADELKETFRSFITTFRPTQQDSLLAQYSASSDVLDQPYYEIKLEEIATTEDGYLDLDLEHVREFNDRLYRATVTYPAEVIPLLDEIATEELTALLTRRQDLVYEAPFVVIRPFNANKSRNMRALNPEDIDQLISITGMVTRLSSLIPEIQSGFFQCCNCKQTKEVEIERGRVDEPTLCTNCSTNHSFQLIHNRCRFVDKQQIKLQEAPEDMPAGQTPYTATMYAHAGMVDKVQPGDRVTVTGIYRAVPMRVNPRQRNVKAVYRTYIDVLHYQKSDAGRLHQPSEGLHLAPDRINKIKRLAEKKDIYEILAHALAPSIYEHIDIKKGILCLLFGGTRKNFANSGRGQFRSDLNVLLCGDPGTSKSQLLQYVYGLVPRGQYTSGKGTSAVGLTAYITKDPDTKQAVMQTGALVLADNGVCCIDEFDKMSDATRSVLHEVMEQQTLSVAKAGIICQLQARTSVLAAANPVDSMWNRDKTIIDNVQLPPTLLSRFDLIFLLLDPQDEHYDRRLAKHLVSLYYQGREKDQTLEEPVDMDLLRDYIAYGKAEVHPKLTEEAGQLLILKYCEMRKAGSSRGNISAFPRQLESLIRLAEGHAKIRLSEHVTLDDVEEAYRLHREALKQSAVDPVTGLVDVAMLQSGLSASVRRQVQDLAKAIKENLTAKHNAIPLKILLAEMRNSSDQNIPREIFEEAIGDLIRQDAITRDASNKVRLSHGATAD